MQPITTDKSLKMMIDPAKADGYQGPGQWKKGFFGLGV